MASFLNLTLLPLLIASAPTFADPAPTFTDPAAKGSLMILENPRIPASYHGAWADDPGNCGQTGDRGVRIVIGSTDVETLRVIGVEVYSDHPAIVVVLRGQSGDQRRLFLDIADDGNHIGVSMGFGSREKILRRCPQSSSQPNDPSYDTDTGWMEQAQSACKDNDFAGFSEAFFRSPFVQRHFLALSVQVVRPHASPVKIARHNYLPPPISRLDDIHIFEDGSKDPEKLHLAVKPLPGGDFAVHWMRAEYDDQRAGDGPGYLVRTYGPKGRLTFHKAEQCWQLTEDTIDSGASTPME